MRGNGPGLLLIGIAFLSFVSLGLPDAVLGVAWPSMRDTFGLHQASLGLILLATSTGYFISSFLSGRLLARLGVGTLLAISTAIVAVSLVGFSMAPRWELALGAAVGWGIGSGAVDAGVNAYAAVHFRPRLINWLHACYTTGAMAGPFVMASVIARGAPWRIGYVAIAVVMAAMALLFTLTRQKWRQGPAGQTSSAVTHASPAQTLALRAVRLQMLSFLVYAGLEVVAGQWTFTLLTEGRGTTVATAGAWVGSYWGSLAIGRFAFGAVVERFGTDRLLRHATVWIVISAALYLAARSVTALTMPALVLMGISLAPVYPGLMARTNGRVGPHHTANAVGFQSSSAMAGAVLLPGLTGIFAERIALEAVSVVLIVLAVTFFLLHERLLTARPAGAAPP